MTSSASARKRMTGAVAAYWRDLLNDFDFARPAAAIAATLLLSACVSPPFSYAEDRCLGQQNQCRNNCASIDNGQSRAACEQRCFTLEDRCYASGADSGTSSLAEEILIDDLSNEREKEAGYRAWKAQKERERAAAEAAAENGQGGGGE